MFYLLFGLHMKDFASFVKSCETTFGMITGKFDFDGMVRASPILGPVTFFAFVLVAAIVLINIFLTLIISAFETVKHDVMKQSNEFEMVEFMMRKLKDMMGFDSGPAAAAGVVSSKTSGPSIEEQMSNVVNKVDELLHFLDTFYYEGQLNKKTGDSRDRVSSAFTRQRRYGWRGTRDRDDTSAATSEGIDGNWRLKTDNLSLQTPRKSMRLKSHLPPSQRMEDKSPTPILNWREVCKDDDE